MHALTQAFSGWAPKEYTEEEGNEQQEDQQQQQPAAANDASASQPLAASHHADDDAAAAAQAPDASQQGWNAGNSDYVYDEATGYWYVASTGAYYDSTTGLYFLPDVGTWHNLDPGTGQYVPVASEGQQQQPGQGQGQQGGGAVVEGGAAAAGQQQQQQQQPRRRGAVIGAAPQYNPHGLLLAAQALEVSAPTLALTLALKSALCDRRPPVLCTAFWGAGLLCVLWLIRCPRPRPADRGPRRPASNRSRGPRPQLQAGPQRRHLGWARSPPARPRAQSRKVPPQPRLPSAARRRSRRGRRRRRRAGRLCRASFTVGSGASGKPRDAPLPAHVWWCRVQPCSATSARLLCRVALLACSCARTRRLHGAT